MIFVLIKFLDNKGSWRTLQSGGAQMARDRLTQGSTKRDLFHYLVRSSMFIVCQLFMQIGSRMKI